MQSGYYPYTTTTKKPVSKNFSTKRKATQVCGNTAKQIQESTKLLFDDPSLTISTNCELVAN